MSGFTSVSASVPDTKIPSKDETPEFCKRVDSETANAVSRLKTQSELIKIGQLMEASKTVSKTESNITSNIMSDLTNTLKTMTLDNLNEYVENKLSKEHYSPEIIYLLFQIQLILLEKENLTGTITTQNTTIRELKKDLISEKTLVSDLKESIKESTTELEEMEKEYERKEIMHKEQYKILITKYETLNYWKTIYEKLLMYLLPITTFIIYVWVCRIIDAIQRFFETL